MKKYFVGIVAIAALFAFTMPVSAETVFNDMSKCIKKWPKLCDKGSKAAATAPKATKAVNPLGNTTPAMTENSGKAEISR